MFAADPVEVAPRLLGKLMVHGASSARIVEVEAYRGVGDPASHAARGPTRRNAPMFGPPGRWYVYFTYGMHWCANVVCLPEGHAGAVLIRAAEPVGGVDAMWAKRPAAGRLEDLCSGPAKLCAALGVDGTLNGTSVEQGPLKIVDDGYLPNHHVAAGSRIGIRRGQELAWRWGLDGHPHLSRRFQPAGSSGS